MVNYEVRLKAVRLVHAWYDDCKEPVVMSSGSLDLLIDRIEQALLEAPSGPPETTTLWTMREVQGLFTIESRVCLEAGLMQEPDAIHCPSQVATSRPGILSIGSSLLTRQLGGVVDQEAGARIGGGWLLVRERRAAAMVRWSPLVLFEVTQFPEAIDNNQARLHESNKGLEVE